ncbi:CocE/NonD family hydrolase [Chloroflexota bacterium]
MKKEVTRTRTCGHWAYTLGEVPVPKGMIIEKDIPIKMRDGINLYANVFRPDKPGKFPIIMSTTPYSKDRCTKEWGKGCIDWLFDQGICMGFLKVSELPTFEAPDPAYWVPNGYIVIYVDVRGMFKSEGKPHRDFSGRSGDDYYDAIEWAGVQSWSNGNVGMSGVSALCMSQYLAAITHPPHLKAIIPWEGITDRYRDTRFPGGVPESVFRLETHGVIKTMSESDIAAYLDPVANQNILVGLAPNLEEITTPALICATWSDQGLHTRGSFQAFRRFSSKDKWLYTHGGPKWHEYYFEQGLEYQKKFFDYYLKGENNGWMETPRVRMEVRDTLLTYTVRNENEWPLARTEYQKLYLNPEGKLVSTKISKEGKVSYNSLDGKAVFDITFDKDTELSGYMKLQMTVSGESDDMDLIIGVHKLDFDGNEVHFFGMDGFIRGIVSRGWLRVSQRELDKEKSTPWQPYYKHEGEQKIKPGKMVPVEIAILPSSTLFHKGETLRLTIQGKDTMAYGRVGYPRLINKGIHTVYTGGKYDSYLLIPYVPANTE